MYINYVVGKYIVSWQYGLPQSVQYTTEYKDVDGWRKERIWGCFVVVKQKPRFHYAVWPDPPKSYKLVFQIVQMDVNTNTI